MRAATLRDLLVRTLPVFRQRERILVLDDVVPTKDFGAGMPRALVILRLLVSLDFDVVFLPMLQPCLKADPLPADFPAGVRVLRDSTASQLADILSRRRGVQRLLVSRPHNMAELARVLALRPHLRPPMLIYDAEAIFANRSIKEAEIRGFPLARERHGEAICHEARLARLADRVIAVTEAEADQFRAAGCPCVSTVADAPDSAWTERDFEDRCDILFVGRLEEDRSPNVDSILWYANEVMPRLADRLSVMPRLLAVGRSGAPSLAPLRDHPNIDLVGPVEDLHSWYDRCRLFIAPTRFAAGLPRKIIESAAAGVPVVATSLLALQLGWRNGVELVTADDPRAFGDACANLYLNRELWGSLRSAARIAVGRDFTTEKVRGELAALTT